MNDNCDKCIKFSLIPKLQEDHMSKRYRQILNSIESNLNTENYNFTEELVKFFRKHYLKTDDNQLSYSKVDFVALNR